MYFLASKILWLVGSPTNALLFGLCAGLALVLLTRWRRTGLALCVACVALMLVAGFSPLATRLVVALEQRFPAYVDDGQPLAGIIVLGGPVQQRISLGRGQLSFNESGERLVAMAALARARPDLPVLFTGGSSSVLGGEEAESVTLARHAAWLGLPEGRLRIEKRSRNTYENARNSRELLQPAAGSRWLLVTSAMHMPRAVGLFRKAGFTVVPYPVDYRTSGADDWAAPTLAAEGLRGTDIAVREWIGLVAARLVGQTDELLPGP